MRINMKNNYDVFYLSALISFVLYVSKKFTFDELINTMVRNEVVSSYNKKVWNSNYVVDYSFHPVSGDLKIVFHSSQYDKTETFFLSEYEFLILSGKF